jgi:hypothetical protein
MVRPPPLRFRDALRVSSISSIRGATDLVVTYLCSIFVFKPMAQVNVLEVQSLFPVTTNFSISLSIAQNPPGTAPSSLMSQPKTGTHASFDVD